MRSSNSNIDAIRIEDSCCYCLIRVSELKFEARFNLQALNIQESQESSLVSDN